MKKIIAAIVICLAAASCATTRTATATSINVNTDVTQYPTIVDLEVSPDLVVKEVSWTFFESIINRINIEKSHETIIYDMLKENNADILLEQRVQNTTIPFGMKTVVISGYPAKFKNFRKPTKDEVEEISAFHTKKEIIIIRDQGQYKVE
ncbi:MAG: hypothetical protein R3Y08_00570 [Rikenellaceae bacterium]